MFLNHFPHPGGSSTAVAGLADALARLGTDVTILCQGAETRWWHHGQARVQMFRRPRLLRWWSSAALREYLRENPDRLDLLVVNGIFSPAVSAVARHAQKGGIPVVVSPFDPYHDAIFATGRLKKTAYWHLLEKRLLQQCAAIQVLASGQGKLIRDRGVTTPVIVVDCGVLPEQMNEPQRAPTMDRSTMMLGHLGRFDLWQKGIDLLLHAVADVKARGLAVQLEMAGRGGSDLNRIQQLVEHLDLANEVRITGPFDGSPIAVIQRWDALVVSSRFDGTPQTAIEAMVAGRPLICSTGAGAAEYVLTADCGVLVEPSVAGISSGIQQLANLRDSWGPLGARGRRYVESHLTWDQIAESALAQYEAVVAAMPQAELRRDPTGTQRDAWRDLSVTRR